MRIIIAGGSGQLGGILRRSLRAEGHNLITLSRNHGGNDIVLWDGCTIGAWAAELDGADAVINLAGRNVNCRYSKKNLRAMMDSRVQSTKIVGDAISRTARPPRVWLQMSTATIYAHRFDANNDEETGVIGGNEPDVPGYWGYSIEIAKAWEKALEQAATPNTRKVALRSAMVMSPDTGGIFNVLLTLTKRGLGGPIAGGHQFVSWIHHLDFVRAVKFLIEKDLSGPVNLSSPNPIPQSDFMAAIRNAAEIPIGLPAAKWMVEIGAFFIRSDTELILKSRRVTPGRLLASGFGFEFDDWSSAVADLVRQSDQ